MEIAREPLLTPLTLIGDLRIGSMSMCKSMGVALWDRHLCAVAVSRALTGQEKGGKDPKEHLSLEA